MKKEITHRIAFYTRKVAERGAHHPSKALPRKYKYRSERLKVYKARMNQLIAQERRNRKNG